MKKLPLLVLLLSLYAHFPLAAQDLKFTPHWKNNDAFNYLFFKNKYNPKDTLYTQDQDTVMARFRVVKASAAGYEMELRYDYSKAAEPLFPVIGLKKVIDEVKKSPIVLVLDSNGKYTGLKNWAELKAKGQKIIAEEKKNAPEAEKATYDYYATKLETKEQIEKQLTEDIEFFFMLYGSRFKRNSTFDYAYEMKNPYGPTPIPAIVTLETTDDTEDKNLAEVKLFLVPDEDNAAEQLRAIKLLVKGQQDDPNALPDDQLFDLQDYYVYLHNTATGTHKVAIYVRYLQAGSKETVESWKFVLQP